ncbi:hypothetical protein CBM2634_A160211 [Cupriavidus taiwanensis]|uniref:Uncharacterized protein n=1 Tax=Cupriavidus taiwanensis TaxID=164546 RepID=A0A375IW23_9BURK|nr:hypothetical protein CBM2634_A160211 [Cupriavidus taiwanensis]
MDDSGQAAAGARGRRTLQCKNPCRSLS